MSSESWDFYLRTQRGLRKADLEIEDNVITIAKESLVILLVNYDKGASGWTAATSCMPLSAKRQVIALANAGGDLHAHGRFFLFAAFTVAYVATFADRFATALAGWAYRNIYKLAKAHRTHLAHLSGTATGFAGLDRGAILRPIAAT